MNGEINKGRINWSTLIISTLVIFLAIVSGYYRPHGVNFSSYAENEEKTSSVSILVVGDVMLDRNVRNIINKIGFDKFFAGVRDMVETPDIAVANLEGTFTTNPSITASLVSKELQFTFDPALSSALADLGFDVMGLANNHSYNFGKNGLESTRRYIGSAGMLYYGDPFNKDEISTVITKNNIRIAFIGFHEFYYSNFDKVMSEIARLRKDVDVIIISPHWGIEYQKEPTIEMVNWAHQFIDQGADIVIGAHPHIVGNTEIYKDKKIYYSLGNFVFDQYFSKATMEGLAVVLDIEKKGDKFNINYTDIPIVVDREGVRVNR